MKRLLLPVLAALALPTACSIKEMSEINFQLFCTTKKYKVRVTDKKWVESHNEFILFFEPSKGIVTDRREESPIFGDPVYKIHRTTRNLFELRSYNPINTYYKKITIDRLTGNYSYSEGFEKEDKEDKEKNRYMYFQHKGNCIKQSARKQLF